MRKTAKRAPRSPDFLCIGAQKAGTTWLHANLRRHQDLWLPPLKELQYFNQIHIPGHRAWIQEHRDRHIGPRLASYLDRNENLNLTFVRLLAHLTDPAVDDDWYRKVFAYAPQDRLCGEMTPEYSLLPDEGIRHLLAVAPEARILFLVRDPIDRCWSQLRMMAKRRGETAASPALLAGTEGEMAARSDYPAIIDRWRIHVPEERFRIGFFDRIATDPDVFLEEVIAFLGLDCRPGDFAQAGEAVHEGQRIEMPEDIRDRLRTRLEPVYDEMAARFPAETAVWRARHYG